MEVRESTVASLLLRRPTLDACFGDSEPFACRHTPSSSPQRRAVPAGLATVSEPQWLDQTHRYYRNDIVHACLAVSVTLHLPPRLSYAASSYRPLVARKPLH